MTTVRRTRAAGLALGLLLGIAACGGGGGRGEIPPPDDRPFLPPPGLDQRLDTDPAGAALSVFPEICGDGDRVYVVWYDRRASDTDIHFNRSVDGGANWLATDRRLDTDPPGAASSSIPTIACAGDRVYVAWFDRRTDFTQIRFNRSLDAGATWLATDVRLDRDVPVAGFSWNVHLACAGDAVYVVWQDARNGESDIYFNRSLNAGTTWLAEDVRIDTDVPGAATSSFPRIACSAGTVHVVWLDERDGSPDVRWSRSIDAGTNWLATDVRLDTDLPGDASSVEAVVACDGANVVVVWSDDRDGDYDIRANASDDHGATWLLDDVRLDTDAPGAAASLRPDACIEDGTVYVSWDDRRDGNADVRFSRSANGGVTWLAFDRRIDRDPPGLESSLLPRIACADGVVHVTWYDNREGAFDVLLSTSPDGGSTWPEEETRLDTDEAGAANSLAPTVWAGGGRVHVAWYDQRAGPGDIHVNQGPGP